VGDSWRADETYIKIEGQWMYLYRAVDKAGRTVDFLLSRRRDVAAAQGFFSRAIRQHGAPRVITLAHSVRGPKYVVKKGKTPVWSREDAKTLLDSIRPWRFGIGPGLDVLVFLLRFSDLIPSLGVAGSVIATIQSKCG
jgi:hypothetical protein